MTSEQNSGIHFSTSHSIDADSLTGDHLSLLDDMRDSGRYYKNDDSQIMRDLRSAGLVNYYPSDDTFKAA